VDSAGSWAQWWVLLNTIINVRGLKERVIEILNQLSKCYLLKKESASWSSLCSNYKGTCEIVATVESDDVWVQNATFGA
jgi:hypothetical protein